MKGHFVYGILRSSRNHFSSFRTPYIIYRNPTCKELSNNIAAREHPRAGSKQMATYQAVAQTQSSWSSSCERTSPRCGRKQMMATYQAVAQTQSSSSSSNLCCSVATQTWSAHVTYSLLHTIQYASSMNAVWRTPTVQPRPQTALLLLSYIFSSTQKSTSRSTRERNVRILLARKIKARIAERRWMRNPV